MPAQKLNCCFAGNFESFLRAWRDEDLAQCEACPDVWSRCVRVLSQHRILLLYGESLVCGSGERCCACLTFLCVERISLLALIFLMVHSPCSQDLICSAEDFLCALLRNGIAVVTNCWA